MPRFEALEPIRQGVCWPFGAYAAEIATGVQVRHDHGRQYMSDDFQAELRFLGMTSSPAFVRAPEGTGVAEQFIRTLKEQVLWVRTFQTAENSASHSTNGCSAIMSRGWSSGRGFAHRLRCATSSSRLRRRRDDAESSCNQNDRRTLPQTRPTPLPQERRSPSDATHSRVQYCYNSVKEIGSGTMTSIATVRE